MALGRQLLGAAYNTYGGGVGAGSGSFFDKMAQDYTRGGSIGGSIRGQALQSVFGEPTRGQTAQNTVKAAVSPSMDDMVSSILSGGSRGGGVAKLGETPGEPTNDQVGAGRMGHEFIGRRGQDYVGDNKGIIEAIVAYFTGQLGSYAVGNRKSGPAGKSFFGSTPS